MVGRKFSREGIISGWNILKMVLAGGYLLFNLNLGCSPKPQEQFIKERVIEIDGKPHRFAYFRMIQGWNEKTGTPNIIETIVRQYPSPKSEEVEAEYFNKYLNKLSTNTRLARFAGTSITNGTDLDEIVFYKPPEPKAPKNRQAPIKGKIKERYKLAVDMLGNPVMVYQGESGAVIRTNDNDVYSQKEAFSALERFKGMVDGYETILNLLKN